MHMHLNFVFKRALHFSTLAIKLFNFVFKRALHFSTLAIKLFNCGTKLF